jgi:hypothetical protein
MRNQKPNWAQAGVAYFRDQTQATYGRHKYRSDVILEDNFPVVLVDHERKLVLVRGWSGSPDERASYLYSDLSVLAIREPFIYGNPNVLENRLEPPSWVIKKWRVSIALVVNPDAPYVSALHHDINIQHLRVLADARIRSVLSSKTAVLVHLERAQDMEQTYLDFFKLPVQAETLTQRVNRLGLDTKFVKFMAKAITQ